MHTNKTMSQSTILVVYDTNGGNAYKMAKLIARGVESVNGCSAAIRAVPKVGDRSTDRLPPVPDEGAPYVELDVKHFLDQTTGHWFQGSLSGKPAGVFTTTGSMHGGQETTLLSMMIPLLHHGMLITGIPYSNPALMQTQRGGTPYGASHVSGEQGNASINDEESQLCKALGKRIAEFALKIKT